MTSTARARGRTRWVPGDEIRNRGVTSRNPERLASNQGQIRSASHSRRYSNSFRGDQRATEGLPIRLVIAVAVGVAAVAVLFPLLGEVEPEGDTEVAVEVSEEVLTPTGTYPAPVTIAVVTTDGQPVTDARLVVREGSAPLAGGPVVVETGPESNEVTLNVTTGWPTAVPAADVHVDFRTGQNRGTLEIAVVPPPGTEFVDEQSNPDLTVVA